MKNYSWYIKRLSKMSFKEVLSYRIPQSIRKITEKKGFHGHKEKDDTKEFSGRLKFLLCDPECIPKNLAGEKVLLDEAEMALGNHFKIFNFSQTYSERIDWHRCPKTGNHWPREKFWSDINIRDGCEIGDPKFVWELNRLYFLFPLAYAYKKSKKKIYAAKFFEFIQSWYEQNPYPKGVNWSLGLEVGIRLANIIFAVSLFDPTEILEEQKSQLNRIVQSHCRYLLRYPSKYSANNNHALGEAFGLFLAGTYFPHLEQAEEWFLFGKKVLEKEVARQILADGGSFEYTSTYLSFVADFFLLFRVVCESEGLEYDESIDHRLKAAGNFYLAISDKNGNIPNIGDQDSAVVINFGLNNHENIQSFLNTLAIAFREPKYKVKEHLDIKTAMLLGESGVEIFRELSLSSRPFVSLYLPNSQLAVIKDRTNGLDICSVGNVTPLGLGPSCGHGHMDALSFTLSLSGSEFLIDPGTYLYHSGGEWRRYFRSAAAHNTIRIGEKDPSDQLADFMYSHIYKVFKIDFQDKKDRVKWSACHDGYRKQGLGSVVQRTLLYDKASQTFKIVDTFHVKELQIIELFFHFHPDCQLLVMDNNRISAQRNNIAMTLDLEEKLNVEIYRGSNKPLSGWYSRSFGHIEKSPTVRATTKSRGIVELNTSISFTT